jgi:hypothetical protein
MRKKLLLIVGLVVMASVSLFTSCKDETTTDNPPSLNVTVPSTTNPIVVDRGQTVTFTFTASYNLNSKSSLQNVTMVANFSVGGSDKFLDSIVPKANENQISITKNYTVPATAVYGSTITVTIKVIDKDGQSAEKSVTLNITNLTDVNTYTSTLGAQGNLTLGSSYATDSGKVYMTADAKKYQGRIDFLYFYDDAATANAHSIAAPNDNVLAGVTSLVKGWSVFNATKFKLITMTEPEFDAITSSVDIKKEYSTAPGAVLSIAAKLTNQTYYAFITVQNKSGIIQITNINEATAKKESSMSIKVKVQR